MSNPDPTLPIFLLVVFAWSAIIFAFGYVAGGNGTHYQYAQYAREICHPYVVDTIDNWDITCAGPTQEVP